jgi:hypothetical protein
MDKTMDQQTISSMALNYNWTHLALNSVEEFIHEYYLTPSGNILRFSFDKSSRELYSLHTESGWERTEKN